MSYKNKLPLKKAEKKEVVKEVVKVEKRGRKKGVKIEGGYKKKKETVIEPQTETVIEPQTETVIEPQTETVIEPQTETIIDSEISNDDKILDSFINENSSIDEFKETEFKETEFKETDFKTDTSKVYSDDMKAMINGYTLLAFCDFIIPSVLKKIMSQFNPAAKKIDASKAKLTEDQKKELKETADIVAKYVFNKMNPIALFFMAMGIFYYSNMTQAINDLKEV